VVDDGLGGAKGALEKGRSAVLELELFGAGALVEVEGGSLDDDAAS
jgi:hypothetical protein